MTDKERELVERFVECERIAREKKNEAYNILKDIEKLAPHKQGEIVKWTEKQRKNVGSWLYPKYVDLPPVEKIAVAVSLRAIIDNFDGDLGVYYKYEFASIKKDGGVSKIRAYPRDGYEWTGEFHKDYKQSIEA